MIEDFDFTSSLIWLIDQNSREYVLHLSFTNEYDIYSTKKMSMYLLRG